MLRQPFSQHWRALTLAGLLIVIGGTVGSPASAQICYSGSIPEASYVVQAIQPAYYYELRGDLSAGTAYANPAALESGAGAQIIASLQQQNPACSGINLGPWLSETCSTGYSCSVAQVYTGSCQSLAWPYGLNGRLGVTSMLIVSWAPESQNLTCIPAGGYSGSTAPAPSKTVGECSSCQRGDPVTVATGNVHSKQTDYDPSAIGSLAYARYYNSDPSVALGRLGPGWRDTYDRTIVLSNDLPGSTTQNVALVFRPDGRVVTFKVNGSVIAPTDADTFSVLTKPTSTTWVYTDEDDTVETYAIVVGSDPTGPANYGQLQTIQFRGGAKLNLSYTSFGSSLNAFLTRVSDAFGHTLTFAPDTTNRRISTMVDSVNNLFDYDYDTNGNLSAVYYPGPTPGTLTGAPERQYTYQLVGASYALTNIVDENGATYATWTYYPNGQAQSNYQGANQNLVSFVYNNGSAGTSTTVTDGAGRVDTYSFSVINGVPKYSAIVTANGPTLSATADPLSGLTTSRTDGNGTVTGNISYNSRGLETSRTEGLGPAPTP